MRTAIAVHCGGKNRRHLICRNIMRSRGCAVQNKGSTLNLNIKGKKSKSKKSESLFFPQEKTLNVTVATVHHIKIIEAK